MSRYLSLALCLVCAPAFGAIITSEVIIGPGSPAVFYNVQPTGHLTVLDGAVLNGMTVKGGRADVLGGNFTDEVWLDDRGTVVNISGGTFEEFSVVNDDDMLLNISGGTFTRGVRFDAGGWGGGVVTIAGGDLTGGNQAMGVSLGGISAFENVRWTAHIHGGKMTGASGAAGNSIHIYGHWLNYHDGTGIDGLGRPIRWQTLTGVLEDGTQFHWEIPGNDSENVYTLHDLGELPGDTNGDSKVDIADLNAVRNNFGGTGEGDADFDGDADIEDLNLVRNRFGMADEQLSAVVPEPSAMVLAGLLLLPFLLRRLAPVALTLLATSLAAAAPIDVFVLAGQSNAWGQGKWADVPATSRTIATGSLYYRPFRDGGFGEVRPIAGQFGLEISFAQAYYERTGRMPAIVKHAIGSTTLAVHWNPETGPLYQEMIDAVDLAMETWTLQGHQPRLAGFLWMQGEHDAKNATYAAVYEDNLRGLVDSVRRDLDRRSLPFVLGRIAVPLHPYRDLVRDAQASVRGVRMIDTDMVHLKDDLVHYNTQGLLDLGRMFADKFYFRSPEKLEKLASISGHFSTVPEPSTIFLSLAFATGLAVLRPRFRNSFRCTNPESHLQSA